jgi:serine/threonine-protein kinase
MDRRIDGTTGALPGCLDEQEAVDFAAGMLAAEQMASAETHLSTCDRCRLLVAAAAPHVAGPHTIERRGHETQAFGARAQPRVVRGTRERPLLDPGTPLDDTYRVVGFLGRGAMGDVYEVRHARLAGRYAAKLLSPDLLTNQQAFSRFRREALIASGLSHPNIVHVIDFRDLADGRPCLVMEYLDGVDLGQEMAAGPFSLPRTLRLVRQIVSALTALHGHRIIHRDLKPQNILVLPGSDGEPERIKLLDFGLAKRSNASLVVTHDKTLLGTPQYMAPEQALGNSDTLGPEADQFSLAAIVYEMLGGIHPFGADVLSAVLYRIVHEPPAPLSKLAPDLPAHVIAAIERGLAKAPGDRFPSVRAFLLAMEDEGASATPPPLTTPLSVSVSVAIPAPARSRRRRLAAGLGAAAAVAGVAVGAALMLRGPAPPVAVAPAPPVRASGAPETVRAPVAVAPAPMVPAPGAAAAPAEVAPPEAAAPPAAPVASLGNGAKKDPKRRGPKAKDAVAAPPASPSTESAAPPAAPVTAPTPPNDHLIEKL